MRYSRGRRRCLAPVRPLGETPPLRPVLVGNGLHFGGRSNDEKAADPARDRLGACRGGGRRLVYFADRNCLDDAGRAAGPLCRRCGNAGRHRRRRQGRHSDRDHGAGHGDAARHRQRQDPDHRPAHQGRVQGRPDGQAGRPAGRGRSAALRRGPAAGDRHDAEGRGAAQERPDRPRSATRSWSPRTRSPASNTTPRPPWSASTKRRW